MPAPPPRMSRDEPKGEARFRTSWTGKLILEVQLRAVPGDRALGDDRLYWVDADTSDLWRLRYHRERLKLEPLL
jgi:hypothetical protein